MSKNKPTDDVGVLYLVATPIGNLEDISLRALRVLESVDIVAAEDTRTARKIFSRYKLKSPKMLSFYKNNEKIRLNDLLACLKKGQKVALISEAGTPGISDPGELLVKKAHEANIPLVPIPGPSALVTALSCSGFDLSEGFLFLGFLPAQNSQKRKILQALKEEKRVLVLYEAPHRLLKTLDIMLEEWGEREVFLAREMTKIHEEYVRSSLSKLKARFNQTPPRGEITLVIEGSKTKEPIQKQDIQKVLRKYLKDGLSVKIAVKKTAQKLGVSRSKVYSLALELVAESES